MKTKYSLHAEDQIKYRNISKRSIQNAIKFPTKIVKSYKNRVLYQKTSRKKTLEVVAVEEGGILIIVTAYYLYEN